MEPKVGSFTAYLESANNNAPSKGVNFPESVTASGAPAPLTILEILARQVQQSLPIWDLQSLSRMDAMRFRDTLKSLKSLDYVAIDGESLSEVVRLTNKGAEAVSLAR